jgi:hypothetical protein
VVYLESGTTPLQGVRQSYRSIIVVERYDCLTSSAESFHDLVGSRSSSLVIENDRLNFSYSSAEGVFWIYDTSIVLCDSLIMFVLLKHPKP